MVGVVELRLRMYLALALIFAIGFGIMAAVAWYFALGIYFIVIFSVLLFALQWYVSPEIMKWASHLKYIGDNEYPQLHRMVGELAKEAGVPVPKIAIAPRQDPNAYVFGRTRNSASLVVHEGLLSMLDENEMRAVLAHEIGHLRHNDVVVMTLVSFLPMLVYMVAQNMMWSGMMSGNRNNSGTAIAIGFAAFIVYFILQLVVLMLSRARESYADVYSAQTTKKPEYLASSLLKITGANYVSGVPKGNTSAKSFYFSDIYNSDKDVKELMEHKKEIQQLLPKLNFGDFVKEVQHTKGIWGAMNSLFATHPPAYKRIIQLAELKKEQE